MPDLTDPEEILRQITEHLELEASMGGDWIPVTRASEPTQRKSSEKPRAAGLTRIHQAVQPVDPEVVGARRAMLEQVAHEIAACRACVLGKSRSKPVPGEGHAAPRLVFVGEGPGADEDASGLPFVGKAGQLLTRMIEAMGLAREEVFIMNTVKCRPPGNRTPEPEEMSACRVYLERQLQILTPEIIVALGRPAAQSLLSTTTPISRLRGHMQDRGGILVMPTFHPAYLLRNPAAKKDAWEDLKQVHEVLASGRRDPPEHPPSPTQPPPSEPEPTTQGSLFG